MKTVMISEMKITPDKIYTSGNITADIRIDSGYQLEKCSRFSRPLLVTFCEVSSVNAKMKGES